MDIVDVDNSKDCEIQTQVWGKKMSGFHIVTSQSQVKRERSYVSYVLLA